jgi:hypothetical protein
MCRETYDILKVEIAFGKSAYHINKHTNYNLATVTYALMCHLYCVFLYYVVTNSASYRFIETYIDLINV